MTEPREGPEEALQRSLKELGDIKYALDQAAIVAITDARGVIRYANDKFCEISKYSREELVGRTHRVINSGYHSREFFRDMWATIASGRVWRGEIRNRAKDGSYYWVDTTIVPFVDERGAPYQYLAIRSDITARKRAEEELRNREALHQLGQMAAVVAHEVKNPLAGIAGALQVIGGRLPRDSPDREVIASILGRIDSLNERLQDLLLFARPKPLELAPVRLRTLLQETASLLARDPNLQGIRLEITGEDVGVVADRAQLQGVLANLMLNAAQAMEGQGRIQVTLDAADGACRIAVLDEGPGIPGGLRERVFEPFFTTRSHGTGLGLAIARRVVEAHGGTLQLHCPPGGGTVMTVRLPVRR
jgi:two-component system CheB/CheR fusion protein